MMPGVIRVQTLGWGGSREKARQENLYSYQLVVDDASVRE